MIIIVVAVLCSTVDAVSNYNKFIHFLGQLLDVLLVGSCRMHGLKPGAHDKGAHLSPGAVAVSSTYHNDTSLC